MKRLSMQEIIDIIQTLCYSDSSKRILISMVGIPGSRKSIVSEEISKQLGFDRVGIDDIRKEFKTVLYPGESFDDRLVFEESYKRLKNALENKGLAIYDATNVYPKWRRKTNVITNYYYDISICIFMDTGIINCIKNTNEHDDPVSTEIIERMYNSVCRFPPSLDEGYDIIFRCKEFDR